VNDRPYDVIHVILGDVIAFPEKILAADPRSDVLERHDLVE
jgi:hypothetical protein